MSGRLRVEVAYAEAGRQTVLALEVEPGTTVAEAIEHSGIRGLHAVPQEATCGIWGQLVSMGTVLAGGERIELYRPLPADPKETRRALARRGRTMGRSRS